MDLLRWWSMWFEQDFDFMCSFPFLLFGAAYIEVRSIVCNLR